MHSITGALFLSIFLLPYHPVVCVGDWKSIYIELSVYLSTVRTGNLMSELAVVFVELSKIQKCLFVCLRFYSPVNTIKIMPSWSISLVTGLDLLSGQTVLSAHILSPVSDNCPS